MAKLTLRSSFTTIEDGRRSSHPDSALAFNDDVSEDDLLSDDDYDEDSNQDDGKPSLKDTFVSMMKDIKQGVVVVSESNNGTIEVLVEGARGLSDSSLAALYEDAFTRLDRFCWWLPSQLVEAIPKSKTGFPKFKPLLSLLLKHPECADFFTWKDAAQGETFLHEATRANHKGVINYICRQRPKQGKAGLEEPSINKITCLHIAAQRDDPDPALVTMLLGFVGNEKATIVGAGGNTPLHLAVDIQRCKPGQERVVGVLLDAAKNAITAKNDHGMAPLRYHHHTKGTWSGYNPDVPNPVASQIEMLLRLSCLRLDIPRDETWEILYPGPTERREFTFDLYGYEEIRADDLNNLSGHIRLEKILKSVVIPDLIVYPPEDFVASRLEATRMLENTVTAMTEDRNSDMQSLDDEDDGGSLDIPADCPGRIDYCWIFKWLREQDVTKIIRVSVGDQKHTSHSDEAIERCLEHTEVEVLDWNKLDICATVFTDAAPRVRDLTVHCSGNNAVLRSWMSPGGLVELEDLRVLSLKIVLGLESLNRTKIQARNFRKSFIEERKKWCKLKGRDYSKHEVTVHWEIVGSDGKSVRAKSTTEDDKKAVAEKQEWISCMEKFAAFIRGYREDVEDAIQDPKLRPPRVKLALIDDGVDGLNADLSCIIKAGQTFSERDDHHYNSYFKSARGHGTIMAMLIRKICPNVKLYVAKLNEEKTGRNSFSITAESVVKAIWWAIDHEVNILSMSFTINQPSDQATIQSLVEAINKAVEKGILIFCSVSDQGPHDSGAFPAHCNRSNSFLIGTATVAGRAWKWNGANEVDYILPGTDLEIKIGDDLFDSRLKNLCESGSSLATALASGLAALILDCVVLKDVDEFERMQDRAHQKMKMAFDSINMLRYNNRDDDKYLRVWDTFGQALSDSRKKDDEKLGLVVDGLMARVRKDVGAEAKQNGNQGSQ
ncbi:hypothetical protein B0I37DRAFT_373102 [Chaetomium sp. MPI-CAGE-AT-0009]|nr:hypothetical protein B0I37DRAFT_373102 [Chaetomium sp. MPI-CAGE-AT-0009]